MPSRAAPKTRQSSQPRTKTNGLSPQFQICALLMAKGDLTREELLADVSADRIAFGNAVYNAKTAGRIVYLEKEAKYRITKEGREWTAGGANLANHKASAQPPSSKAAAKKRPTKKGDPTSKMGANLVFVPGGDAYALKAAEGDRRFLVIEERSFRCAVFSDGSFHLAKNGQAIDLTAVEHAEMLRYIERMAEQPA